MSTKCHFKSHILDDIVIFGNAVITLFKDVIRNFYSENARTAIIAS